MAGMKTWHLMIVAAVSAASCSILASIGTHRWISATISVTSAVTLGVLSAKNARKQVNTDLGNNPPSAHQ
jgi:hypothetical protein